MSGVKIPVSYGNVGVGDQIARVGIQFDRTDKMTLEEVDRLLCGKRVSGKITAHANGDDPSQKHLPGTEGLKHEIVGAFDVKGFRVSPKNITAGLSFSIASIDANELPGFAKKTGTLFVDAVAELEDTTDEGEAVEGDDDDTPLLDFPHTHIKLLRKVPGHSPLSEGSTHEICGEPSGDTVRVNGQRGREVVLGKDDYVWVDPKA